MKKHSAVRLVLLAAMVVLGAGCETIATRIQEKSAVYAQLDPHVQEAIHYGLVGLGFTPDMVYMALGKPTHETVVDPRQTVWTYFNFNAPNGKFFDYARTPIQTSVMSRQVTDTSEVGLLRGQMTTVAGASDLRNGEVRSPDPTIRRKTADEMMQSTLRQDLHVRFVDSRVVDVATELVPQ